jgi:phosphatidylglycerophosphate synthase
MSLRNSKLAEKLYQFSQRHVLPVASRYFQTPNHLTTTGAVVAAGVPIGFYIHPIFGWLTLTISAFADVIDGHLARSTGQASDFGAFWDSSLDRISDFFYLIGFGVLFRHASNFLFASFLVGYGIAATFMISYIKAKAESLGKTCRSGLMERGFRTVYLIIWALGLAIIPKPNGILWLGMVVFCLLTTITVIQRIIEIRNQFPSDGRSIPTSIPHPAPKE